MREALHEWEEGVYGKSLYVGKYMGKLLYFNVNLKLLKKDEIFSETVLQLQFSMMNLRKPQVPNPYQEYSHHTYSIELG